MNSEFISESFQGIWIPTLAGITIYKVPTLTLEQLYIVCKVTHYLILKLVKSCNS